MLPKSGKCLPVWLWWKCQLMIHGRATMVRWRHRPLTESRLFLTSGLTDGGWNLRHVMTIEPQQGLWKRGFFLVTMNVARILCWRVVLLRATVAALFWRRHVAWWLPIATSRWHVRRYRARYCVGLAPANYCGLTMVRWPVMILTVISTLCAVLHRTTP